MFEKGFFMLFLSLGLGYALCVMADTRKNLLRTVGYTLGVSIIVLSLGYALMISCLGYECPMMKHCAKWMQDGKMSGMMEHGKTMKCYK